MKTKLLIILICLVGLSIGGFFIYKNIFQLKSEKEIQEEAPVVEEEPKEQAPEEPEEKEETGTPPEEKSEEKPEESPPIEISPEPTPTAQKFDPQKYSNAESRFIVEILNLIYSKLKVK